MPGQTFLERRALRLQEKELRLRVAELNQRKWQAEYEAKSESERLGFRGLVLINGGAAIALGALLQAIVGKDTTQEYVPWVLWAIAANGIGVVPAAFAFIIGYLQWMYEVDAGRYRFQNPWWWAKWAAGFASIALFVTSVVLVVVGGLRTLVC